MRTSSLLAIFATATLSSAALAAPPAVTPAASNAAILSVQTIERPQHTLRAGEVDGITGTYNMADGQTLRVSFEQRRLFAEVGQRKTEIVAVATNTFAARGDAFTLVFDELPFASNVTLSSR